MKLTKNILIMSCLSILMLHVIVRGQDTTFTITSTGDIGIGVSNPMDKLHIVCPYGEVLYGRNNVFTIKGHQTFLCIENGGAAGDILFRTISRDNWVIGPMGENGDLRFYSYMGAGQSLFLNAVNGYVGIGSTTPDYPLTMQSGAHVTEGGVWTNASSRQLKENIRDLTYEQALNAVLELHPVIFNYKSEKDEDYVGFIAEDVPPIVSTADKKSLSPMDIVAILTKVVQDQQLRINSLEKK